MREDLFQEDQNQSKHQLDYQAYDAATQNPWGTKPSAQSSVPYGEKQHAKVQKESIPNPWAPVHHIDQVKKSKLTPPLIPFEPTQHSYNYACCQLIPTNS